MIGLDTSAIIDILRGNASIKKVLEKNHGPLAATMMSYLELSFGLDTKNQRHKNEEDKCDAFFESLHVFNFDKTCCKKSAEIFWHLKEAEGAIEKNDCTIAGILLTNGITTIITKNEKHFKKIPHLKVITY